MPPITEVGFNLPFAYDALVNTRVCLSLVRQSVAFTHDAETADGLNSTFKLDTLTILPGMESRESKRKYPDSGLKMQGTKTQAVKLNDLLLSTA